MTVCGFCGREIGPHDGYGATHFSGDVCGVRVDSPVPFDQTCLGRFNAAGCWYNKLNGEAGGVVRKTESALCTAARAGDTALVLALAQDLHGFERLRLANGTIDEYFKRVEAELRAELRKAAS